MSPHPAQVISLGVEKEPVERAPGRRQVRRLAGPDERIDGVKRGRLARRRILRERIAQQRGLPARTAREHQGLASLLRLELREQTRIEARPFLGQDFSGVLGHDIGGELRTRTPVAAHREVLVGPAQRYERRARVHLHLGHTRAHEAFEGFFAQRLPTAHDEGIFLLEHLDTCDLLIEDALHQLRIERITESRNRLPAIRAGKVVRQPVRGVRRGLVAAQFQRLGVLPEVRVRDAPGHQRARNLAMRRRLIIILRVDPHEPTPAKALEDVHVPPVAERPQQCGSGEFLLLVDVDVDDVVDVEGEFDPGSAERDDPRREKTRAVGVQRLFEYDAGGTVKLAHDDPLRSVHDERSLLRQERQIPEIDFLLQDIAGTLFVVLADRLEDDQPEPRLQRRGVGHVALDALLDLVLRVSERVADELQREVLVDVRDREDLPKNALETEVPALLLHRLRLQQTLERLPLHVQEMRHVHGAGELVERDRRSAVGRQIVPPAENPASTWEMRKYRRPPGSGRAGSCTV